MGTMEKVKDAPDWGNPTSSTKRGLAALCMVSGNSYVVN